MGEVFGDIYGNLFAKDVLWMFRNPTRAQRFPAAWMDGVVGGLGGTRRYWGSLGNLILSYLNG